LGHLLTNPVCATKPKSKAFYEAKLALTALAFFGFANNGFQRSLFHDWV